MNLFRHTSITVYFTPILKMTIGETPESRQLQLKTKKRMLVIIFFLQNLLDPYFTIRHLIHLFFFGLVVSKKVIWKMGFWAHLLGSNMFTSNP